MVNLMLKRILFLLISLTVLGANLASPVASSGPVDVVKNAWALGTDNAKGCPGNITDDWQHNGEMSLSRCSKNPAPPTGAACGGAAFKCGPTQGQCSVNTLGESWQDFNAQERGVPLASEYAVSYSHLMICVGCTFVKVELLGSDSNGATWDNLGTLLHFIPGQTAPCDTATLWDTYCGSLSSVPHYDLYRLYITGKYHQQSGYKFTGVSLLFEPVESQTPDPTATATPTATPTGTPEPTETPQTLLVQPGVYKIACPGAIVLTEPDYVICRDS